MDIVVTALHMEVPERFRRHVEDKLGKVEQLSPRAHRVDVKVSHESNRRQSDTSDRVEITVHDRGPVIRAEACAADPYVALDLAHQKLLERLRRARDRRKPHHGRRTAASVRTGEAFIEDLAVGVPEGAADEADDLGESPIAIREKVHAAPPMTLDDALYQMELVGHDFYLFNDAETHQPSVVYRRRGWSYGVLRLEPEAAESNGMRQDAEVSAPR